MSRWFERYQQGLYQEVYDELLLMQEQVFDEPVYREAMLVARAMMSRVRSNIKLLIPRLKTLGYQFVDGDWVSYWEKRERRKSFLSAEQQAEEDERLRIFRSPPPQTSSLLDKLEQRVGRLPLSLKAWYEEVGSVNFIGMHPASIDRELSVGLDPLLIIPVDDLMGQFPFDTPEEWEEAREEDGTIAVDLAVDADLKYNYSGSGGYSIKAPCLAFDTTFDLIGYYESSPTFVNYLRTCFRWGGMFGLSTSFEDQEFTPEELEFLTKDLLPF